MNTPKSTCFYHKEQTITNFCRDKKCLMPLCPNCIGEHSIYHEQNNSKPMYHSIYEMLTEVEQKLYHSICSLEADRTRINELTKNINAMQTLVQQKLSNTKLMVYEIVESTFKQLEAKIFNKLASLHEQTGLYCLDKTKKYHDQVSDAISQLYEIHEGLKGQKYLGHAILFLKDKEQQATALHGNLATYLETNENYEPKIELSNQFTTSLVHCLNRMFKLEGKKQFDRRKEQQRQESHSYFPKRTKDVNEKNEKIQRSYTPKRSASYLKSSNPEPLKTKSSIVMNNVPYYPTPKMMSTPEPLEHTIQRYNQPGTSTMNLSQFSANGQNSSRIQDFKLQYEMLSRKVSQMRKQSQAIARKYK